VVTLSVFLFIVAAIGAISYVLMFFSHVPGAKDERLGVLEDLPADLGTWIEEETDEAGLIKEKRYLLADSSGVDLSRLVIQVRYKNPDTSEIVRVLPEQSYRRKRRRGA
jgi:hypothetical protein